MDKADVLLILKHECHQVKILVFWHRAGRYLEIGLYIKIFRFLIPMGHSFCILAGYGNRFNANLEFSIILDTGEKTD